MAGVCFVIDAVLKDSRSLTELLMATPKVIRLTDPNSRKMYAYLTIDRPALNRFMHS